MSSQHSHATNPATIDARIEHTSGHTIYPHGLNDLDDDNAPSLMTTMPRPSLSKSSGEANTRVAVEGVGPSPEGVLNSSSHQWPQARGGSTPSDSVAGSAASPRSRMRSPPPGLWWTGSRSMVVPGRSGGGVRAADGCFGGVQ